MAVKIQRELHILLIYSIYAYPLSWGAMPVILSSLRGEVAVEPKKKNRNDRAAFFW
ncbi:MAG: hypothetical protein ACKO6K_05090 [Chitinophagaceae bacterium]